MYSLSRAYSRANVGARLKLVEDHQALFDLPTNKVNETYPFLILILTHNTQPTVELFFDYHSNGTYFNGNFDQSLPFSEWLKFVGGKNLSNDKRTKLKTAAVNVADIWEAGFKLDTAVPGGKPSKETLRAAKRDLYITHPTLKADLVGKNIVVSSAGYLHQTYWSEDAVYARGGGRTLSISNETPTSVISFANLGGCTTMPITPGMLQGLPEEGVKLNSAIYINTPDFDWTGKTAFFVLGGYLIPPGKTFNQIGDKTFEFKYLRYPIADHFFESEKILDLNSVRGVLTRREGNDDALSPAELYQREFIQAYLTHENSFIIAVNSPGVYVEYDALETIQTPGVYLSPKKPTGIAITDTTRIIDYLVRQEPFGWSIHSSVGLRSNYLFDKSPWMQQNIMDGREMGYQQKRKTYARMMTIATDTFTE